MATQTIYTNKDTYTDQNQPSTPLGAANCMLMRNLANYQEFAYVGFDITSAPAAADVTNVMLYYYDHLYSGTQNVYISRITSSWGESTATWNNAPTTTSTNSVTCAFPNVGTWASCNVTNMYKDAKNAGNDLGFECVQSLSTRKCFSTKEYSSGTYKMYIVITYAYNYYVKIGGNDASDGRSWANAWATVNKAATTVPDASIVHIGFGDYVLEPAANKIAPQNIGTLGIEYLPETATTGGGTGTVSIEQNA